MVLKCAALLFVAVGLAGCCVSGNGCYAPLPGSPVAWDGLGPAPTDTAQATDFRPRKISRPKKVIVAGPIGDVPAEPKPRAKDEWEQQEAADRADEAKLAKQLIICRGCSPPPARDDQATGRRPALNETNWPKNRAASDQLH
jgi:hypothetical protein